VTYNPPPRLLLASPGGMPIDVEAERRARAESLRLTQLALGLELHGFDLPQLAHWVHTGTVLPDAVGSDEPDAARWEPSVARE